MFRVYDIALTLFFHGYDLSMTGDVFINPLDEHPKWKFHKGKSSPASPLISITSTSGTCGSTANKRGRRRAGLRRGYDRFGGFIARLKTSGDKSCNAILRKEIHFSYNKPPGGVLAIERSHDERHEFGGGLCPAFHGIFVTHYLANRDPNDHHPLNPRWGPSRFLGCVYQRAASKAVAAGDSE